MDWIDVLWTIAITEALLLRGGNFCFLFFVFLVKVSTALVA